MSSAMGFMDKVREAQEGAEQQRAAAAARHTPNAPTGMEYRVDILREKLVAGHVANEKLADLLNKRANEGWTYRQIVDTEVSGRVAGGTGGLIVVFERLTNRDG